MACAMLALARRGHLWYLSRPMTDREGSKTGSFDGHGDPVGHSLSRRSFLALSAGAAAVVALPGADALAAPPDCHPTLTPPEYLGLVPSPLDVLGFEAGRQEVTTSECFAYLDAVAAASDRVTVGTVGASNAGRPIRYAVIGRPDHVTGAGLEAVRQAHLEIVDPSTSQSRVDSLAASTPAFLWVTGNIHGNEESGADAIVSLLYDLADRDDCVVNRILRHAVVIVVPIQNPDGRDRNIRRNGYAFDLNRDHFGRTQPETDAKLELMRRYPPQVLTDHHEFGYYRSFFPPTDDPVYHEVTDRTVHDIYDDLRPGDRVGVRPAEVGVLQPGLRIRLLLTDLHRHRDFARVPRGGDDDRGLRRSVDLQEVEPSAGGHVDDARHRGRTQ